MFKNCLKVVYRLWVWNVIYDLSVRCVLKINFFKIYDKILDKKGGGNELDKFL